MGRRRRLIKTTVADANASRDLISALPVEVKDRILECLPTRDAARTALLSKCWNDVWLQHGRLAFDGEFLLTVQQCQDDYGQKELIVRGPTIDLPVNACGIFSNVTSLAFFNVIFKCSVSGIASSISFPKLEKLAFRGCRGINKFEIGQPKLEMLSVIGSMYDVVDSRWLAPHLKAIKNLSLSGSSLWGMDVSVFPTAINLQVMRLYELNCGLRKHLIVAMQLLQKCPNLCELQIIANVLEYIFSDHFCWKDEEEAASRLLEDPNGGFVIQDLKMGFVIQDLKMLNTIKIESFSGSAFEMLFMKILLSKFPIKIPYARESCYCEVLGYECLPGEKNSKEVGMLPLCISKRTNCLHGQLLCVYAW